MMIQSEICTTEFTVTGSNRTKKNPHEQFAGIFKIRFNLVKFYLISISFGFTFSLFGISSDSTPFL
jgi:hypothetical protein